MLRSKAEFGDVQLHVEFATPSDVKGTARAAATAACT